MSLSASYDAKQRVKQAIDIVDLIQSYLPLRREGRGFKALCPWHDDTRPSLQINPDRQSFKCWVCDIGGDIFSFVMKMEGVEFGEALSMLADRAGISLQPPGRGARAPADEKRVLYQAMAWAAQRYHEHLLKSPAAADARAYLAERHIADESVRRFQLGFAPDDWSWIGEQATGTAINSAMLERIGLVVRRKQGPGFYDRFKGRVLFPIFDSQGRAVGLGGRVLPNAASADAAKYVNSPETPLFSKSNLLYGLNAARDAIRKTGTAIVVEGYTDCIVAHQFGFENTVAVLGTALGASHLQLLRRYADRVRVVLLLDGDQAGRKRALEMLELFVAANVDLRVLTLPEEMDPAEFLLSRGPEALARLIEGAADALAHAFHVATDQIDLQADLHAATAALENLIATIAKAPRLRGDTQVEDRLREERFLQRLASDFRVSESETRRLMTELRRKSAARQPSVSAAPASTAFKPDPLARELLEIVLFNPSLFERIAGKLEPGQFACEACRAIYVRAGQLWSAGILPDFQRLLLEIEEPRVKNLLVELDERGCEKGTLDCEARLLDVLSAFENRQREDWARSRTLSLKQGQMAEEDELALLVELERRERERQQQIEARARLGISDPTEG